MTVAFEERAVPIAQHLVYTRRRANGALPTNGELDGWELDDRLLCERVIMSEGPHGAIAHLRFVPRDNSEYRVEFALGRYSTDDQVKIVMLPIESELIEQPATAENGIILFEGVMLRRHWKIQTSDQQSAEGVSFTAVAFPFLDDVYTDHLITGRWLFDRQTPTEANDQQPFVVYSPSLPAVFNHQGRPNMGQQRIATGLVVSDDPADLTSAFVFTHDDDPAGRFWTVRAAIASILMQWLLRPQLRLEPDGTQHEIVGYAIPHRHVGLDPQLIAELSRPHDASGVLPEHKLLGSQLPEVNVHGIGPLSAIAEVCKASGFCMALEPVQQLSPETGVERRYQLRLWQRGQGRQAVVSLAKANSSHAQPEYLFRDSNIHGVEALDDGKELVNEVITVGESFVEGAIVLRPAWNPDDVDASTIDHKLRSSGNDALLAGSGYHARHCQGGRLFDQYGQVGRIWVADCVGDPFLIDATDVGGYASGIYKHDDEGADFPTELGLTTTANNIEQERVSLGVPGAAPIRWSNRLRRPLPLRSPAAQALGQQYILEVSENGGSTWQRVDARCYRTLREHFGIQLVAENLAEVNAKKQKTGQSPPVAESWWALIQSAQLLFRLTSAIKSDHGAVGVASRQSTSGSVYRRGQLKVIRGAEEVWQAPAPAGSAWARINPSQVHRKVVGWGGIGGLASRNNAAYSTMLSDAAVMRRSELENRRLSISFACYIWTYGTYRLGDAITAIRGRDIPLATNSGQAASYPNIVSIEIVLSPSGQQGMALTCEDQMLRGGSL